MYTLKIAKEKTFEVRKSKFITKIFPIYSIEEKDKILNDLRDEYKDATHICYFYKIDGREKATDDGEPSSTFVKPVTNFVEKSNLNCILIVVIRYFGGIKLGAGGLMRAYSNSIIDTFKEAQLAELIQGYKIKLSLKYDDLKRIDYILKDINNIEKIFDNEITYILVVPCNMLSLLSEYNPIVLENVIIAK